MSLNDPTKRLLLSVSGRLSHGAGNVTLGASDRESAPREGGGEKGSVVRQ